MPSTNASHPNFTVIVNWKERGFGCSKVCSYCNWRSSPLLPNGPQSPAAVSAFISQCKKSFITISGGGDPLYRFDENHSSLDAMSNTIKSHGFKVRIITREIQHVEKLKGLADYVSVSLDDEVLQALPTYQHRWEGIDVEFSLVLPPLPSPDLIALKPQYAGLRSRLGRRLVLRENFNSIFPLDPKQMSFGHSGIVCVPKSLCLNSRYLSTIDCTGHDIVQDNSALAGYLMNHPDVFLFGGFVKHLVAPSVHLEYGDIDAIITDPLVMTELTERFAFDFKSVSPEDSYPRYFLGKSVRAGKSLQLILMRSEVDAKRFIFNAQYGVDCVGCHQSFLFFEPSIGEVEIRRAIRTKTAEHVHRDRDLSLFQSDRNRIEQRHKAKLLKKGFTIHE